MSEENDKMSGSGLPLQPGTPAIGEDERSQFWEIIRMLDDGLIQDDEAAKRLMRIYQTSFAGQLRALGETNPEVLGRVMTRLNDEMRNISERFDASASQPIGQQTKKLDISALRMKSKKSETLLREEKVVGALARDGNSRPFVLSELVEQLEDPEIELEAALVLYEKGVKLTGSIQKVLESAEQRVAQVAADGSLLEEDEASDEA